MLVLVTVGLTVLIRAVILLRGYLCGILATYSWFYSYIFSSLVADVAVMSVRSHAALYTKVYWESQFVTLAIGCGLILEIFRHVLEPYAGAERFARIVCMNTFAAIFVFALIYRYVRPFELINSYQIEIERDVRTAQIFFFLAILGIIAYYGIPLGRNMRGMIYGYGLYLGASVVTLALRVYVGSGFNTVWRVMQPLSFDTSLVIWMIAFWVYAPNPQPKGLGPRTPEGDYEALAALTKERMAAMRHYLGRPIR